MFFKSILIMMKRNWIVKRKLIMRSNYRNSSKKSSFHLKRQNFTFKVGIRKIMTSSFKICGVRSYNKMMMILIMNIFMQVLIGERKIVLRKMNFQSIIKKISVRRSHLIPLKILIALLEFNLPTIPSIHKLFKKLVNQMTHHALKTKKYLR